MSCKNTALAKGRPKMMEELVQTKAAECGLRGDVESGTAYIKGLKARLTEAVQIDNGVKQKAAGARGKL